MIRLKTGVIGWLLFNAAWLAFVVAGAIIAAAIIIKERKTIIAFLTEGR